MVNIMPSIKSKNEPFLLINLNPMVTITGDRNNKGKAMAKYLNPFINKGLDFNFLDFDIVNDLD